ncbi:MAG TPA: ABC transporter permease [Chitinispirillaceae bacterium]|nr:ABC transporter permease [Chitinispirillaceae bacterium]
MVRTGNIFRRLLNLLIREIRHYGRDSELIILSIVLPLLLSIIFIWIYGDGMVRELPVAVFDEDKSELSRTMIEAVRSSSAMDVVESVHSIDEIKTAFRAARIQGAFYFPVNMERDLKRNRQVYPVLFKNSQNILCSGFLLKESLSIFKTFNGGILLKKLRNKGLTEDQAMSIIKPVNVDGTVLFNANFNYKNFLSPGIILAQFQLLFMISGVLLLTREYDRKSLRAAYSISGKNIYLIFFAKLLVIMCISGGVIALLLGVLFNFSGIYVQNVLLTFAVTMVYVMVSVVFGMGIGVLIRNTLVATEIAVFLGIPAFILSGYTLPLWAVPKLLSTFAEILPYKHFFTLYFKVAQMNAPLTFLVPELSKLLLMTLIFAIVIYVKTMVDCSKFKTVQKQVKR